VATLMTISPAARAGNAVIISRTAARQSKLKTLCTEHTPAIEEKKQETEKPFRVLSFMLFRSPRSIQKETVHSAEEPSRPALCNDICEPLVRVAVDIDRERLIEQFFEFSPVLC